MLRISVIPLCGCFFYQGEGVTTVKGLGSLDQSTARLSVALLSGQKWEPLRTWVRVASFGGY